MRGMGLAERVSAMNHTISESSKVAKRRTPRIRLAAMTDRGLVRVRNEDAHIAVVLEDGSSLLAVADGMGGHADGDVASTTAIEGLLWGMQHGGSNQSGAFALRDAVRLAHHQVSLRARGTVGASRMGTTLTAVHVRGRHAHIAQVGDSRAYVIRGGQIERLTRDQSYGELLVDLGHLAPDEVDLAPFPHTVLQALGHATDIQVALSTLDLRDHDCLLVCSDGLTGEVRDDELKRAIACATELDLACEKLVELANLRGGGDNVTAVLGSVTGELPVARDDETVDDTHRRIVLYEYPRDLPMVRA